MNWTVEILNHIVKKELDALPKDLKAKFLHIAHMLEDFGPHNVGEPFIKSLKNSAGLWEIRMKGKSGIARAIYVTAHKRRIVILHSFIKKTQKTPKRNLEIAQKRLLEMKND